MKLKNRIMSWILSPGAYALWHSMGNPEEWERSGTSYMHKQHRWISFDAPYGEIPPIICGALICIIGSFAFDLNNRHAIGLFERHLIAGRGYRLAKRIYKQSSTLRKNNMNLFTTLTVNETVE